MTSVTYWTRLEPRPRSENFKRGLMAEVRDPLWFLTRQWQVGEFDGDDAGSLVHGEIKRSYRQLKKFADHGPAGTVITELEYDVKKENNVEKKIPKFPLETVVEHEKISRSLKISVQMGQNFERMLTGTLSNYIPEFRKAYPLKLPLIRLDPASAAVGETVTVKGTDFAVNSTITLTYDGKILTTNPVAVGSDAKGSFTATFEVPESRSDKHIVRAVDARDNSASSYEDDKTRYFRFMSGRGVMDGFQFKSDLDASLPQDLPPKPFIPDTDKPAVLDAAKRFYTWYISTYRQPSKSEPDCWRPERLEYNFAVSAPSLNNSGETVLVASEYSGASLDWYSFSLDPNKRLDPQMQPDRHSPDVSTFLPANVKFKGMPNRRWWDFEDEVISFGAIDTDKRDIAKMIVMDFALISSNDWFIIPLILPVGSLTRIDSLIVTDVFGERLLVKPAEETLGSKGWSMFKISYVARPGEPLKVADFLFVAPSLGFSQESPPIEKVNFIRDEMANMVWAVEQLYQNELGETISGYESYIAQEVTESTKSDKIKYIIQTKVPRNWTPFLPVQVPGSNRAVDLQLGTIFTSTGVSSEPKSKILNPENVNVYRIKEEEVPRAGVVVTRSFQRSRWIDGSTYLWIGRRKSVGRGEGSSGLRFDIIQ